MTRKATIHDVARTASVSIKTVSRVLNGSPEVKQATAAKVRQAMQAHGYQPNVLARGLARNASDVIGVAIGHGADAQLSNPFVFQVLNGITAAANQQGYQVMLVTSSPETPMASLILAKRVAGMVFISVRSDDEHVRMLHAQGLPFVLTCHFDSDAAVPFVDLDGTKAGQMVVDHLVGLGHGRIAILCGPSNHGNSHARREGYEQGLAQHDLPLDRRLIKYGDFNEASGICLTRDLLQLADAPTAIFACSDQMALGALHALRQAGLAVPQQVSVVGFDDIPMAQYWEPPLTTIRQDGTAKGTAAADMLIQLLDGKIPPKSRLLEPELMVRQSTGPVPREL